MLHKQRMTDTVPGITDAALILTAMAFTLAGIVKGITGLGLFGAPVALLTSLSTTAPIQTALLVIVAANGPTIWQALLGGHLFSTLRRFWPLLLTTAVVSWLCSGFWLLPYMKWGVAAAACLILSYSIASWLGVRYAMAQKHEKWAGAFAGSLSGLLTAATGQPLIPSIPFMEASGIKRDQLVQAINLVLIVSSTAQFFSYAGKGIWAAASLSPATIFVFLAPSFITKVGLLTTISTFTGLLVGQVIRHRMQPEQFRRWFLIAMLLLGIYLAVSATLAVMK
ncbi:MAG: hypothetical protein CFE29_14175 [Bradyrhizobiaceae bacterium PARB1]|nr:MAG: hypothetical protein CFE29_14175 [Bradyrhizobiaceae bacterium PARB1]